MSSPPELYRWQLDALVSWLRCGRRGVIEAVTGSGKTDVAIAAAADALRRAASCSSSSRRACSWSSGTAGSRAALPGARIGRLGDSGRDVPHVVRRARRDPPLGRRAQAAPARRRRRSAHRRRVPRPRRRRSCAARCSRSTRNGSASPRRSSAATTRSPSCCSRTSAASVTATASSRRSPTACARRLASRSSACRSRSRSAPSTLAIEQRLVSARQHLRPVRDMPLEPFGDFLAAVAHLAERDAGADGRAARDYLDAFSKRRQIVAQIERQVRAARQPRARDQGRRRRAGLHRDRARREPRDQPARSARVDRPDHRLDRARRSAARSSTISAIRKLDAVAAPRVLDEGIDVPDANLGVVMSASRTRRQMIQRMGRILRRKRPGIAARFVIMFAKDTLEDPANRIERDGFLDEIERISEATGVFDAARIEELDAFLAAARARGRARARAPRTVRSRSCAALTGAAGACARRDCRSARARTSASRSTYALLSFPATSSHADGMTPRSACSARGCPSPRLPPYLELELADAPADHQAARRAEAAVDRRGPLEIARIGAAWRISCTGCGEASRPWSSGGRFSTRPSPAAATLSSAFAYVRAVGAAPLW